MQAQKRHLIIVAFILIAALGSYFGVRYYNQKADAEKDTKVYKAFSLEKDNVREISVTSGEGTYVLEYDPDAYASYQKSKSSEEPSGDMSGKMGESESTDALSNDNPEDNNVTGWSFGNGGEDIVNASLASSLLDSLSVITSEDEIADTSDASQFGFDAPSAVVTVKMADGTTRMIEIGSYNDTIKKYYLRADGGDKIYTVEKAFYTGLAYSHEDITDAGEKTGN